MDNIETLNRLFKKFISKRDFHRDSPFYNIDFRVNCKVHRTYDGNCKGLIKINVKVYRFSKKSYNSIVNRPIIKGEQKQLSSLIRNSIKTMTTTYDSDVVSTLRYFVDVDNYIIKVDRVSWRELNKNLSL